ncbi:ABC transporter permease subunit [Amycolatopsis acidiphila]|uniref:ABC transporter permease subunit n=1 Tax=Amycolatopsis acidiphila TaxID=715473 RepID=A0A558AJ90_9PSEU|nr:ABC transporter permease subunit [Amycolatopsis acidiphila]TVT24319.1 ABC transporter permease subunit [Amycolatopsis acidiphila]UIJ62547.1 ABC transporter permease subunit [Amycolatopsis acidiphila]GHG85347.1 ABC transporter permease [Amycolatopsis acidiphila]
MTTAVAPMPGARVTQARVLASEWVKFRSLRSSYVALAANIVVLVGFGIMFSAVVDSRWTRMNPIEQARFDPTVTSLRGLYLAQLIIGVLGVLVVSGEYSTGMIRASLSAAPRRLPVLWAKLAVFAVVTFAVTVIGSFVAFFAGQAMLSSQHIQTTLGAPGVLRAVLGTALYLTVVGLLGVALGWILRHTAGAIATLFGVLLVLPALVSALPDSWSSHVDPYLPSAAGQALTAVRADPTSLAPWTGFAVFCGYLVVAVIAAAVLLERRDA